MAGLRLRSEGGMNFEASGGFLKWLLWGCFLLSLPGVSQWLVQESVPGAQQISIAGANGAQYTAGIARVTNDFVSNFLVGHVVPVVAASLVFKAVLDMSQGYNPLASIIVGSARGRAVERERVSRCLDFARSLGVGLPTGRAAIGVGSPEGSGSWAAMAALRAGPSSAVHARVLEFVHELASIRPQASGRSWGRLLRSRDPGQAVEAALAEQRAPEPDVLTDFVA